MWYILITHTHTYIYISYINENISIMTHYNMTCDLIIILNSDSLHYYTDFKFFCIY